MLNDILSHLLCRSNYGIPPGFPNSKAVEMFIACIAKVEDDDLLKLG